MNIHTYWRLCNKLIPDETCCWETSLLPPLERELNECGFVHEAIRLQRRSYAEPSEQVQISERSSEHPTPAPFTISHSRFYLSGGLFYFLAEVKDIISH